MTIDEALAHINGALAFTLCEPEERAVRDAFAAVAERARAEGVAQCVEWLRGEAEMAAVPACRDAYKSAAEHLCVVDECGEGSALARLLAAHGREAAARAWTAAADIADGLASHISGAGYCFECDAGEQAVRDLADDMRNQSAALREAPRGQDGGGA